MKLNAVLLSVTLAATSFMTVNAHADNATRVAAASALGSVAGTALGKNMGGTTGATIGAALGGAGGAAVKYQQYSQQIKKFRFFWQPDQ